MAFIVDSPWLPGWAGISTLDYFSSEKMWFDANLRAVRRFPDVIFLPGFWAEFGMCTEPSAFGAKCSWPENELPFPERIITDVSRAHSIRKPNPRTDGLPPFVLKRLKHYQGAIEEAGHAIKFAVSRGPLNIAAFLAGTTEFLIAIRTDRAAACKLLGIVTDFIVDWLRLQIDTFASIDGVFILDDIVGLIGEDDFKEVALPYLTQIFQSFNVTVKFFHNDAAGLVCAPYLVEIGVSLFNFSFRHSLAQMKELTANNVTLLGNIPPRDVLAMGTPAQVRQAVKEALKSVSDRSRIIMSCGGGMPGDVSAENIDSFLSAVTAGPND